MEKKLQLVFHGDLAPIGEDFDGITYGAEEIDSLLLEVHKRMGWCMEPGDEIVWINQSSNDQQTCTPGTPGTLAFIRTKEGLEDMELIATVHAIE